jgi:hypothetical protein
MGWAKKTKQINYNWKIFFFLFLGGRKDQVNDPSFSYIPSGPATSKSRTSKTITFKSMTL